jgi:hypothetical protein
MKKYTIVLFSIIATISVSSQEVVSTQGDSYSNAISSIDFTIREVVINTGTHGTKDLKQGFHQTNWNFAGLQDFAPNYEDLIYPNPKEDRLNIRTSNFENVTYTLSVEQTPIQESHLALVNYSLTLHIETQHLKTPKQVTIH